MLHLVGLERTVAEKEEKKERKKKSESPKTKNLVIVIQYSNSVFRHVNLFFTCSSNYIL